MLRYLMSYPKKKFRFIRPVHAIPKRINGNISKKLHAIWKILFILGSYEFLACLECISINGLSFGHSDWDPTSVFWQHFQKKEFFKSCLSFFYHQNSNQIVSRFLDEKQMTTELLRTVNRILLKDSFPFFLTRKTNEFCGHLLFRQKFESQCDSNSRGSWLQLMLPKYHK